MLWRRRECCFRESVPDATVKIRRNVMNRTHGKLYGRIFLAAFLCMVLGGVLICSCERDVTPEDKIMVVASIFPVYDFARHIGGENAHVTMLLPPGTEPHSYEPTPRDIKKIADADIFVYTGAAMEPWVDKILGGIDNPGLVVIDSSDGIVLLEDEATDSDHNHGHEHNGGTYDPHIWTDFTNAKIQVDNILFGFLVKDPENAGLYEARIRAYKEKLDALDGLYRETLSHCEHNKLISAGHFSFSYLARRYGIEYYAVYGLSPNAEPSPAHLAEIVELVRDSGISFILGEEMMDPRTAKIVEEEAGIEILMVNPVASVSKKDFKAGITFIDVMTANLENFSRALGCQR
jgi:zinc transport system substrate-binding protein